MVFTWKDEYSVGIDEIDNQHKNFISLLNELYDAIQENKIKGELSSIFDKVINYAKLHFETEEGYFIKFNYPYAEEHIAAHKSLMSELLDKQRKLAVDEFELSFELMDYMENWLVSHLGRLDKKYADYFKERGLI